MNLQNLCLGNFILRNDNSTKIEFSQVSANNFFILIIAVSVALVFVFYVSLIKRVKQSRKFAGAAQINEKEYLP